MIETRWNDIVGHDWAVDVLRQSILHERIGHAWLITGPAQVGKTTLARTFAMALNCETANAAARPCGHCRTCRLITDDRHPDVRLLQPDVNKRGKQTIKIEAIRQLQASLQLAAVEARYKIAIIRQFDAATIGAANAFLKTLEEPPSRVVLLLTATDADALLDTIRSRCRVLGTRPSSTSDIEQALMERWQHNAHTANSLAHYANGRLGWAVRAGTDPKIMQALTARLNTLQQILQANTIARFQIADKLTKRPEELPALLNRWLVWWRDALLLCHEPQTAQIVHVDDREALMTVVQQAKIGENVEAIHQALTATRDAQRQLLQNANTRLTLENLFLSYPRTPTIPH